ncbi:MAG: DUF362 domain-containing protein [Anaerolineae bacterium]
MSLDRRAFLRLLLSAGGVAAAASFLESCAPKGEGIAVNPASPTPAPPATLPPTAPPSATPAATATAAPSATVAPTGTTAATATTAVTPTTVASGNARVVLVKTRDRVQGIKQALELLNVNPVQQKTVFLKPNFNSADPTPGSTHPDTLRTLVESLWAMGAGSITLGDRSGMGNTRDVLTRRGVFDMGRELNFETLVLDELPRGEWTILQPQGSHWQQGFPMARPCLTCDAVVQTCCLKTHRFGGHFTLSLKNSVGLVGKYVPGAAYNYMNELHGSPHQRRMIAEINTMYQPALIVMDGVEAFVNGGPDTGKKVWSEAILAATDRVALDAVGVAILRLFGTTPEVSAGRIFELDQIARAAEMGVGVDSAQRIDIVTSDADSAAYAAQIRDILQREG